MPDLRNNDLSSLKSKITTTLKPLNQCLSSLSLLIINHSMNDVVKHLRSRGYASLKNFVSVCECLLDMVTYIDVVIDNADVYYYSIGIVRRTPASGFVSASDDIDNIEKAASRCIDIVDTHAMPK